MIYLSLYFHLMHSQEVMYMFRLAKSCILAIVADAGPEHRSIFLSVQLLG